MLKPDITHDEVSCLILNLARTRGETGFTEAEGCIVIDWARQAKLDAWLLAKVLSGEIGISVRDGEVAYHGIDVQKLVKEAAHV